MPAAAAPRFRPGQRVRVRRMRPAGHTRCPRYVRGAVGVIERVHGDDLLADAVARGEERARRGALRRALPLRRPLRPRRGAALPRARRPLGVLPRGARLMHDHDHDHGHDHGHHERPASRVGAARARARGAARRARPRLHGRDRRRRRVLRERRRPAERRARGRARLGRSRVPRAAAQRRQLRDRRARLRRRRGRAHGRRREHAGRPQRDRLHALLVLPVARARPAADLVQERGLPRARRRRAARAC